MSSQRFSPTLMDAAATYGVQTKKGRDGDGTKIHGLRIRDKHIEKESWLDAIENEGQMKTGMKDNSLKMKEMKGMKTSSSDPDEEKVVVPFINWEEIIGDALDPIRRARAKKDRY